MTKLISINVECHSGYRADEYPTCFYRDGEKFEITEIIDRWYQADRDPECPVSNYFRVKTTSGGPYIIKHDLDHDEWYLLPKE
jgi:hypothetical protein